METEKPVLLVVLPTDECVNVCKSRVQGKCFRLSSKS